MGHPIHKHMHTHITKQNVKAAIKDDKAHMDYLKRDVKDDQKFHAKDKDARQTADEQHITNLAQDVKYDEKKEGMSRNASPLNDFKGGLHAKNEKHSESGEHLGPKRYSSEDKGMSRHSMDLTMEKRANLNNFNPIADREYDSTHGMSRNKKKY